MNLYTGCVENRKDPLKLGRCQVRVVGIHTHDKTLLPTDDLPWAFPMQPVTSAAMNGIGAAPVGVVEGTWVIVMFRDEDMQQPIILGTFGGIPQKDFGVVEEENDNVITLDAKATTKIESTPKGDVAITTGEGGIVTDGDGNPVMSGSSGTTATLLSTPVKKPGSLVPPASAQRGIAALNKAMDEANITGKYGRAAILGIAGGESGWIPQSEGYIYRTPESLQAVFPKTFKTNREAAVKYANWKGSRESFFNFLYAPENNGSQLGNNQPGDGGRFFGRGFIQITGRANYTRYAQLSGVDIISRPELLNDDFAASAKVAVAYFKDRVKVSSDDPRYFQAALKAVGGAASGFPKKEAYYQYFLGDPTPPPPQTDKSTRAGEEVQEVPTSPSGVPADREQNLVLGFRDPNMKYPLRDYIGEPDTNRLARGVIKGTCVELKDEKLLKEVPLPGEETWDQPDIPFNARYPYNKVFESESGHVFEIDDTPENERIHFYHRKGTYTEIDSNGTQVNRIVGDGYSIIERNGYVVISGECKVTVTGAAKILVQNDAHIQVDGDTKIDMKGNANFGVAKDFNITVGGDFKVKAAGGVFQEAGKDINTKASGSLFAEASGDVNAKAGGSNKVSASGSVELNAGGRLNLEGSTIHLAEGAANASGASASGLGDAPEAGEKSTNKFEQLKPQPRNLEEEIAYETPEENADAAAAVYHEERKTETPKEEPKPMEEAPKPNNEVPPTKAECGVIFGMTSFPTSYVLHTDSTGYKWTLGTLLRDNTLTPGKFKAGLRGGMRDMTIQEIVCNLKALAINICGPLNEQIGRVGSAWQITSCYRSGVPGGGSTTSQHLSGSAIDISVGGNYAYQPNYDWANKLAAVLPYDQLLLEYRDPGINGNRNPKRITWIHISYNNYGQPTKDLRTFLNDKTYAASKLVLLA